jgi:hypothetical protein
MTHLKVDDLRQLIATTEDRAAVLVLLRGLPPDGTVQFITYGKKAEDKVQAVLLRELIEHAYYEGEAPEGKALESFILDAAINKERLDNLIAAAWKVAARLDAAELVVPPCPQSVIEDLKNAIRAAKGLPHA